VSAIPTTLRKSDFGATVRVTVTQQDGPPRDITNDTITFRFKKPSGTTSDKGASIVTAASGICQYVIESGLLDESGTWRIQAVLVNGSTSTFRTEIGEFVVEENL